MATYHGYHDFGEMPLGGIDIKPRLIKDPPPTGFEVGTPGYAQNFAFQGWQFWAFLIFVFIVIVAFALVLIFLIAAPDGKLEGESCSKPDQCGADLYCSADNQCVKGTPLIKGDRCEENSQCIVGKVCENGFCGG